MASFNAKHKYAGIIEMECNSCLEERYASEKEIKICKRKKKYIIDQKRVPWVE